MSALSCHGIPTVVENLTKTTSRTVENLLYKKLCEDLRRISEKNLYETRFAPFSSATTEQRGEWKKLDYFYEEVLSSIPREIEVTETGPIPFQEVLKEKEKLFPGFPHINVEKNAQTTARGLWVLGLKPIVYQQVYQDLRKLLEPDQKVYVSNLATCAITKMLEIQKIRPRWMTGLSYEQLYGIYTLRRALAPKSTSLSVLAQQQHLTVPHPKEDNEIFAHTVDCALLELSLKPRAVLEMHRSYKACFESGRETGGVNGFSEQIYKARSKIGPQLFRSDMNPSKDIPVFTEDIGQRGYVQQKEGMHLLEIAIHQLKHQGTPKLLGVVIEERGMKSRIPLVPQWCAAVVAAVIGDCMRPYVERFCESTFHGQVHNSKRAIPNWWSSGDFENSSDNLKFEKLRIAGKKMLMNCQWPKQFFPYLAELLECLEILLGEHLVYEIDNESLRHEVRARFLRKEVSQAPTYSSNWALTGLGWAEQKGEQEKKGVWAPWDTWEGPHPRRVSETDRAYESRLKRLATRTHAKIHEKVPFPVWTGTRGKMGKLRAETRDLTFQELQLKKSHLDGYPCIRTKRAVQMCYGFSFPIMSFMTWISHYEMTRSLIPFMSNEVLRPQYGFDITGDDNSSGHEDHKSMDALDARFADKGFIVNTSKSYRSRMGYIHAENVYVYPIIGTQIRRRVDIREPKMKVLFPDKNGANWSELPQIVMREFSKCTPEVLLRAISLVWSRYYHSYNECLKNGLDIFTVPREPIMPICFSNKEPNNQLLGTVLMGHLKDVQNIFICKARAPKAELAIARVNEILSFCREKPNHLKPSITDCAEVKDYDFEGFGKIALKWVTEPPWKKLQIPGRPIKITAKLAVDRFKKLPYKGGHINLKDLPKYKQKGVFISSSIADLSRGFHWIPSEERIDLREVWPLQRAFTVVDYRNIYRELGAYTHFDVISATIDYFGLPPEEAVILVDDWIRHPKFRFGIHWVLKGYPLADHTIIKLCKEGKKQGCWMRLLTKDKDVQRQCLRQGVKHVVDFIEWKEFPLRRRIIFPELSEIQGQPRGHGENFKKELRHGIKSCLSRGLDPFHDRRLLQIASRVPAEQLPTILAQLGAKPDTRWDTYRIGLNDQIVGEKQRLEAKTGPIEGVFEEFIRQHVVDEPPEEVKSPPREVKVSKPIPLAPPRKEPDWRRDSEIKGRKPVQATPPQVEDEWDRQVRMASSRGRGQPRGRRGSTRGRGWDTARPLPRSRGRGRGNSQSGNWRDRY
jgi:hypothetical protein